MACNLQLFLSKTLAKNEGWLRYVFAGRRVFCTGSRSSTIDLWKWQNVYLDVSNFYSELAYAKVWLFIAKIHIRICTSNAYIMPLSLSHVHCSLQCTAPNCIKFVVLVCAKAKNRQLFFITAIINSDCKDLNNIEFFAKVYDYSCLLTKRVHVYIYALKKVSATITLCGNTATVGSSYNKSIIDKIYEKGDLLQLFVSFHRLLSHLSYGQFY